MSTWNIYELTKITLVYLVMISDNQKLRNKGIRSSNWPGVSWWSTVFMTLMEFTSWSGPQSVHASSPKCRSANNATLNGAPARIITCLSASAAWASLNRMAEDVWWDDDPMVENTKRNSDDRRNLFHNHELPQVSIDSTEMFVRRRVCALVALRN